MNLEILNGLDAETDGTADIDIHPGSYAFIRGSAERCSGDMYVEWTDLSESKKAQLIAIHERAQELAKEVARVLKP